MLLQHYCFYFVCVVALLNGLCVLQVWEYRQGPIRSYANPQTPPANCWQQIIGEQLVLFAVVSPQSVCVQAEASIQWGRLCSSSCFSCCVQLTVQPTAPSLAVTKDESKISLYWQGTLLVRP